MVIFSIISWYLLRRLFRLEEITITDYVITALSFIIFLGTYSLLCFLAKKWRVIVLVSLFSALSFFLSFHFLWYNLAAAILFFISLVGNFGKVKNERVDRISINIFRSLRHSLFWSLIVLFAFAAVAYYFALQEKTGEEAKLKLPPIAIKATSNYLGTLLSARFFPGATFKAETTVDDLIRDSLESQFDDPAYNILSVEEKEQMIEEQIPKNRRQISEEIGFELSGREKMTEVILRASNNKINQLVAPYRNYIPIVFAFSLFLTLMAVSPLIRLLSIFFAFILFEILIAARFIKIEKVQREIEVVRFNNS